jgi:uncharacterized protein YkwD
LLFVPNLYAQSYFNDLNQDGRVGVEDAILALQVNGGLQNNQYADHLSWVIRALQISVGIPYTGPGYCLNADEAELGQLTNQYRVNNGLPGIPLSRSLSMVARWHVIDLVENNPVTTTCNMHSWSDQGYWQPVCYTSDHAQAAGMWYKPKEITGNIYQSYGFEISSYGYATPVAALNGWMGSEGHNNVILNLDIWTSHPWAAMGVGSYNGYRVIWFGEATDPLGIISECQ